MHPRSPVRPGGDSPAAWLSGLLWALDFSTMTAWIVGAALAAVGAPSEALAADLLAWALMTLGSPRRVWPRPVRAAMVWLILVLALVSGASWLIDLLRRP